MTAPSRPDRDDATTWGVLSGFRACAILGVVLIHVLVSSGWLAAHDKGAASFVAWALLGNILDVFFIASGFLLFMPAVRRSGDLGDTRAWLLRRAARLFPAYWLCLAVALALVLAVPPSGTGAPSAVAIVTHIGALQMPARILDSSLAVGFGINGPLWMVSVIAAFYCLLPLVARAYLRHPLLGLAGAAAITVAWKELVLRTGLFDALANGSAPPWAVELIAIDQLPGWAFSFGLGMTGAWAYVEAQRRWSREQLASGALILLPVAVLAYGGFAAGYGKVGDRISGAITGSVVRSDVLLSLGSSASRAVLMAVVVMAPFWLQRPFANRLTARLARFSYGIYLIHFLVIVYAPRYLDLPAPPGAWGLLLWCAVVLSISSAFAVVSRRLVERPAIEWARRRSPPRPEASVTSVGLTRA